jgi:hypothetical protein
VLAVLTVMTLYDHHAIGAMIPPAIVMAAVLLDHDGLRVGGLRRRRRKGNAKGGKGGECQDNLTHVSFSSGVNGASTRERGSRSNFCGFSKLKACSSPYKRAEGCSRTDSKPGPLGVMSRSALTHAHAALHGKIERRLSPPHRRLDARVIAV